MDNGTKIVFGIYTVLFWVACGVCFGNLIKDWKRCKIVPFSDFYFGKKSIRKILEEKRDIQIVEIVAWISYMLMFFSSAIIFASVPEIRKTWDGMGEFIDELPEMMFSGIAFFSVVSVFVNINKNIGIGIDSDTLVKEYKIKRNIKIMILMIVQGYVSDFFSVFVGNITKSYPVYFGFRFLVLAAFALYMVLYIKSFWNIIDILFGEKVSNRLIKKLYEELWYSPIRKIRCKNKTVQVFEKLLQEYIEASKAINLLTDIKYFEFNTNVKIDGEKDNRYNRLKNRSRFFLICIMFFWYIVGGLGIWLQFFKETVFGWKIAVGICVLITFVIILCFCVFSEGVTIAAIAIFFGRYGYRFTVQKSLFKKGFKVNRYVREVAFVGKNKYYRFIRTTKNIIALFLMICTEKNKAEIKRVIELYKSKKEDCENVKIILYMMDYLLSAEEFSKEIEELDFNHSFVDDKRYMEIAKEFLVDVTESFTNAGTIKNIKLKDGLRKNK